MLLAGLIALTMFVAVFSLPVGWLLMLFLGNVGVQVGYWGCIPGAAIIIMSRMNTDFKKEGT